MIKSLLMIINPGSQVTAAVNHINRKTIEFVLILVIAPELCIRLEFSEELQNIGQDEKGLAALGVKAGNIGMELESLAELSLVLMECGFEKTGSDFHSRELLT